MYHLLFQASRYVGRTIRIGDGVIDDETPFEIGMIGLVVQVRMIEDDVFAFDIETRPFDDVNLPLMTSTYYDRSGDPRKPLLTARQAGHWHRVESYYLPGPDMWPSRLAITGRMPDHLLPETTCRGWTIGIFGSDTDYHQYANSRLTEAWIQGARLAAGLADMPERQA